MIEYQLKDADGNTYSLNGELVDRSLKNSVTQGRDAFTFDNKIIERSFLPGSSKIGESRIMSRQLSISLNRINTSDEQFKLEANELLYWLSKSKYLVERAKEQNETDLISSYKLDGTPDDSSGNNNDAILVDPEYVNGVSNKALTFTVHTSRMTVSNIDFDIALSICTWFRIDTDTGLYQTILDQSDSENIGIQASINPVTGHLSVYGLGLNYVSEKNYIDGQKHFIIISYDNHSNASLRLDGPIVQEADISNTFLNNTYIFGQNDEGFYEMDKEFIGQEYTNELGDLATTGALAQVTQQVIGILNGQDLLELTGTIASVAQYKQSGSFVATSITGVFLIIGRKSTEEDTKINFENVTDGIPAEEAIRIVYATKTITVDSTSLILDVNWLDDNTFQIWVNINVATIGKTYRFRYCVNSQDNENTIGGKQIWSAPLYVEGIDIAKVSTGLQARYHFQNNADDAEGTSDGTLINSPTFVSGKSGKALQCDGINQYMSSTIPAIGTQDFWVSFWFKPDLATRLDSLCGMGDGLGSSTNGWVIFYRGDTAGDPIQVGLNDGSVTAISVQSSGMGDLTGAYHHIACNFDRNGNVTLYLDNVLIITEDISTHAGSLTDTTLIVAKRGTVGNYFDGATDEFNIGIGLLDTDDIANLYNYPSNAIGQTLFPFVDGTHSADVIDEAFTMLGRSSINIKLDPRHAYDTDGLPTIFKWHLSATQYCILFYNKFIDKFSLEWYDGGTLRGMNSEQFDDGTAYIDINQELHFFINANLISGGQNDTQFIILDSDGIKVSEMNQWLAGTPDIMSSTFTPLSIGHNQNIEQSDSVYELLQVYKWDGVKPTIASSADIDDYLETVGLPLFAREFKDNYEDATVYADGHQLDGFIDEVKFYNKKLTLAEGDNLYKHPGNNDRQIEIVIEDADITYDPGSLKKSSDDNFNLLALNPYWEDVDSDSISDTAIADTIKSQSVFNEGYLKAYPIITLVATIATPDVLITLDSDGSGIQIQDSAFGTAGNLTMIIDCETGVVSINDLNRNVNIVEGTGFFGIPVGEDNIDILSDETITYTIEWRKRYFI